MQPLNPDLPASRPTSANGGSEGAPAAGAHAEAIQASGSTNARLLRIFIDESARYRGRPLHEALLEMLKKEGCAGATVSRAISGFGGHGLIHNANLVDVMPQLPLIVEVVDHPAQLEKIRPRLEEMVEEGLIMAQDVDIWKYSYRPPLKEVPGKATVEQVMTRSVVSVRPDTSLTEVVRLLLDQDYFKALPVVNSEQKLVGIITDGDLLTRGDVPHRLRVLETLDRTSLEQLMAELHHNAKTASDVMTAPAVTVRTTTPVREASRLMVDRKLKRLPVVDGAGHLVGMLGRLDVLKLVSRATPARQRASGSPAHPEPPAPGKVWVARDVMVTEVPTVGPKTPAAAVLERLVSSPLRRLVVVNDQKKVLGVITDADLVERVSHHSRAGVLSYLAHGLGFKAGGGGGSSTGSVEGPGHQSERRGSARTAEELMKSDLVTVDPDAPLEEVVKLMVQRKVKFLPVENSAGQLLGVVLRSNLLRAVTETLERE
ncbi:MAG TPA: DUF190 domain-containing protein [Chloroflexia bacterium]|nr:DUF190 domain-containing protein [Chloroflexia bacterium]